MTPREYLESYRIYLRGEVETGMLESYDTQEAEYLKATPERRQPVTVVITSQGGKSILGRAISERIRLLACVSAVSTLAIGDCSSAATHIFAAVPRAQRFTTANTHFFLHEMARGKSEVMPGTAREREVSLEYANRAHVWLTVEYAWSIANMSKACGCSKKAMRSILEAGKHLLGDEAVSIGLAGSLMKLQ